MSKFIVNFNIVGDININILGDNANEALKNLNEWADKYDWSPIKNDDITLEDVLGAKEIKVKDTEKHGFNLTILIRGKFNVSVDEPDKSAARHVAVSIIDNTKFPYHVTRVELVRTKKCDTTNE